MDRAEKRELVASLNQVFNNTGVVVVTHNPGLTVAEMNDLRSRMRERAPASKWPKTVSPSLPFKARNSSTSPTCSKVPSRSPIRTIPYAAPKVAGRTLPRPTTSSSFSAVRLGSTNLDADGVKALANLPSLDELRGKLVGLIQTPATDRAGLKAPAGQLARVFGSLCREGRGGVRPFTLRTRSNYGSN